MSTQNYFQLAQMPVELIDLSNEESQTIAGGGDVYCEAGATCNITINEAKDTSESTSTRLPLRKLRIA